MKNNLQEIETVTIDHLAAVIGGTQSGGQGGDNGDNPLQGPWVRQPAGRPHKEDGGGTNPEPGEDEILVKDPVPPPAKKPGPGQGGLSFQPWSWLQLI